MTDLWKVRKTKIERSFDFAFNAHDSRSLDAQVKFLTFSSIIFLFFLFVKSWQKPLKTQTLDAVANEWDDVYK